MTLSGHSFVGCPLVHLAQNIDSVISFPTCFLLIFIICQEKVCKFSLLKFSNILLISWLMPNVEGNELTKPWLNLPFFLVALM